MRGGIGYLTVKQKASPEARHLEAGQSADMLRLDQSLKLLHELIREMLISQQHARLDIPLLSPFSEIGRRDERQVIDVPRVRDASARPSLVSSGGWSRLSTTSRTVFRSSSEAFDSEITFSASIRDGLSADAEQLLEAR